MPWQYCYFVLCLGIENKWNSQKGDLWRNINCAHRNSRADVLYVPFRWMYIITLHVFQSALLLFFLGSHALFMLSPLIVVIMRRLHLIFRQSYHSPFWMATENCSGQHVCQRKGRKWFFFSSLYSLQGMRSNLGSQWQPRFEFSLLAFTQPSPCIWIRFDKLCF